MAIGTLILHSPVVETSATTTNLVPQAEDESCFYYTHDRIISSPQLGGFPPQSNLFRVEENVVVSYGVLVDEKEVTTIQSLRQCTSVPLPRVLNYYRERHTGLCCIVMEYIDGQFLEDVYDSFSEDERDDVIEQLGGYLRQLRQFTSECICSVDGSEARDVFLRSAKSRHPSVMTEEDFLAQVATFIQDRAEGAWVETVRRMLAQIPGPQKHAFVLSHGELTPKNILVQGSKIVGIIDWSQAGYYPVYWEYVKANFWETDSYYMEDRVPDRILEPHFKELAVLLHARNLIW